MLVVYIIGTIQSTKLLVVVVVVIVIVIAIRIRTRTETVYPKTIL